MSLAKIVNMNDRGSVFERLPEEHPALFGLFLMIGGIVGCVLCSMQASHNTISMFSGDAQYTTYTFTGALWITGAFSLTLIALRGFGRLMDVADVSCQDETARIDGKGPLLCPNRRDISEKRTTAIAVVTITLFAICVFAAITAGHEGLSQGYTSLGKGAVATSFFAGLFGIGMAVWWVVLRYESMIHCGNDVSADVVKQIVAGELPFIAAYKALSWNNCCGRGNLGPNGLRTGMLSSSDLVFMDDIFNRFRDANLIKWDEDQTREPSADEGVPKEQPIPEVMRGKITEVNQQLREIEKANEARAGIIERNKSKAQQRITRTERLTDNERMDERIVTFQEQWARHKFSHNKAIIYYPTGARPAGEEGEVEVEGAGNL